MCHQLVQLVGSSERERERSGRGGGSMDRSAACADQVSSRKFVPANRQIWQMSVENIDTSSSTSMRCDIEANVLVQIKYIELVAKQNKSVVRGDVTFRQLTPRQMVLAAMALSYFATIFAICMQPQYSGMSVSVENLAKVQFHRGTSHTFCATRAHEENALLQSRYGTDTVKFKSAPFNGIQCSVHCPLVADKFIKTSLYSIGSAIRSGSVQAAGQMTVTTHNLRDAHPLCESHHCGMVRDIPQCTSTDLR